MLLVVRSEVGARLGVPGTSPTTNAAVSLNVLPLMLYASI